MKFLFDFFPLITLFATYKLGGAYPETALAMVNQYLGVIVSGGAVTSAQAPMTLAIALATIATAAQVAYLLVRGKEVVFMLWMALFGFVFFLEVPALRFWVGGALIVSACALGMRAASKAPQTPAAV